MTPRGELLRDDFALAVDLHEGGEHEPVDVRVQRADVGRELERQHRDGAVGEVDAGAAQAGLGVDGRCRAHVVADVGDVDVQRVVAVGELVDPDGVVEVAGGLAVDGDDRHLAEVAAAFEFLRGDHDGDGLGLLDHLGREAMRQVVLADDDFDVDSEIVGIARESR